SVSDEEVGSEQHPPLRRDAERRALDRSQKLRSVTAVDVVSGFELDQGLFGSPGRFQHEEAPVPELRLFRARCRDEVDRAERRVGAAGTLLEIEETLERAGEARGVRAPCLL